MPILERIVAWMIRAMHKLFKCAIEITHRYLRPKLHSPGIAVYSYFMILEIRMPRFVTKYRKRINFHRRTDKHPHSTREILTLTLNVQIQKCGVRRKLAHHVTRVAQRVIVTSRSYEGYAVVSQRGLTYISRTMPI